MHKLYWKGISNGERAEVIQEVGAAIGKHGTLLNFQRFSDIDISFVVELESDRVNAFYNALHEVLSIEGDQGSNTVPGDVSILLLNITFTKGTGDLEIENS
jgi:hypothetical protein